jgi:hypothetical protein
MHGKEAVIAPLLSEHLDVTVMVPEAFDTDRFGTFTREILRHGTQLEAAFLKAEAVLRHTGGDLALASEGSFGPHPEIPFINANVELVVLLDRRNGLRLSGSSVSLEPVYGFKEVTTVEDAVAFANVNGFPEYGMIVRPFIDRPDDIRKGISSPEVLVSSVESALKTFGSVFVEVDVRAHKNPARMAVIAEATRRLLDSCQALCPECNAPGFVCAAHESGLPCRECGCSTEQVMAERFACLQCGYVEKRAVAQKFAEPAYCAHCNP